MRLQQVLAALGADSENLKKFSVKSLFIFGSVARNEATDISDVDLLVEFEPGSHVGFFKLSELKFHLEDVLGCRVDLATPGALREEMRERIMKEAIRAA